MSRPLPSTLSAENTDAPPDHLQGRGSEPLPPSPRKETASADDLLPPPVGAQADVEGRDAINLGGDEANDGAGESGGATTPPTPPRRLGNSKARAAKAPPKRSSRIQALNEEAGGAEHKQQQPRQGKQHNQQQAQLQERGRLLLPNTPPPPKKPNAEAQRLQDRAKTGDSRNTVLAMEAKARRQAVNAGKPFTPPQPRRPSERRALGPELDEAEGDVVSHNTDLRTALEEQVQEAAREAQVEVERAEAASRTAKSTPKKTKETKKDNKGKKRADDSDSRPSQLAKAAIINSMTVSPNLREGGSGARRPTPVSISELFASPAKAPARQTTSCSNE